MDQIAPNAFLQSCPSRPVLARIGEKWAMLALACLAEGPVRFGSLRRTIEGISQKMLTQTLRNLEQDGLVSRHLYNEMPLRVEYELTPLGRTLLPIVTQLKQWTELNLPSILKMQVQFTQQKS
jgi:DNA-binding HxlR family transcriptional regulator